MDFRTWMRSCNRGLFFARSRGACLHAWESVARGRESGAGFVASFAGSVAFVDRAVTATWRCLSRVFFSHLPVCSGVCERVHDLRMSWWRWRMCSRVCLRSVSSPVFLQPSWSAGRPTSRARLPASQQWRRISRLRSSTASKPRAALGRPRNVEAFGTARDAGKAAESPGRTLAEAPEARNGPGTSQEGFGTARDAREGPGKPRAGPAGSPGSPQWSREAPENLRISQEGFGTAREGTGKPRAGPAGSSGSPEWPREAPESSGTSRKGILRGQRAQLPQLRYNSSQNSLAGPHNSYNLKIKRRNYYSLL